MVMRIDRCRDRVDLSRRRSTIIAADDLDLGHSGAHHAFELGLPECVCGGHAGGAALCVKPSWSGMVGSGMLGGKRSGGSCLPRV